MKKTYFSSLIVVSISTILSLPNACQQDIIELISKTMEIYVDGRLVKSLRTEDRVKDLDAIFQISGRYKMMLKFLKHTFAITFKEFLDYMIKKRGIDTSPKRPRP